MSDLTPIEKYKIEKLLGMGTGYVLNFSDRTFQNFILENVGIDIYQSKYDYASGSKANRLRGFWNVESNFITAKLLKALLELHKFIFAEELSYDENLWKLFKECEQIINKLEKNSVGEHLDAIKPNSDDKDFHLLSQSIRESIQKNEPQLALDRLHTFTIKFIRGLCDKYGIEYDKDKPLHSLFGEYIKYLKKDNLIETKMTETILKSSISLLDTYNNVRNNKTYAHDNEILNYNESMLIFKNISSVIEFVQSIEENTVEKDREAENLKDDYDLPF
jgi:hypothetical protein